MNKLTTHHYNKDCKNLYQTVNKATSKTRTTYSSSLTACALLTLLASCAFVPSTSDDTKADNVKTSSDSSGHSLLASAPVSSVVCGEDTGLYQELKNPPILTSKNQLIDTDLTAAIEPKCVNKTLYTLQSYVDKNAGIDKRAVGPAYILDVGKKLENPHLKIKFSNKLGDPNAQYHCGHDTAGGQHSSEDTLKCTNLHTHGFHISPKGSNDPSKVQSDYVFITITPATQTVQYDFDIPNFHAPGTHWMHAHLHGSTAPQVQNGMAGALILRGDIDNTLTDKYGISLKNNNDKIMILQQMKLTKTPLCGTSDKGKVIATSINGQCLPKITGDADDIQRWRFIHAGISATLNLALVAQDGTKYTLHEFARDGITLNGTQIQENILLQPGYRSDVLVQFPQCSSYPCEMFLIDEKTTTAESLWGEFEPDNAIAKIVIVNKSNIALTMPDPAIFTNPYPFICDPKNFQKCTEALPVKKVWFANEPKDPNDDSKGTYKTVNGGVYPNTPVMDLTLNDTNTWKLWVGKKQSANGASHPFHIHVNPFQVVDDNGFSYWKDTLLVSGTDNYGEENAITVVSQYENFDGEFVLHCHNLSHEDDGMMMKVKISK